MKPRELKKKIEPRKSKSKSSNHNKRKEYYPTPRSEEQFLQNPNEQNTTQSRD